MLIVEIVPETDELGHINFVDSLVRIRNSRNVFEFRPEDEGFADETSFAGSCSEEKTKLLGDKVNLVLVSHVLAVDSN